MLKPQPEVHPGPVVLILTTRWRFLSCQEVGRRRGSHPTSGSRQVPAGLTHILPPPPRRLSPAQGTQHNLTRRLPALSKLGFPGFRHVVTQACVWPLGSQGQLCWNGGASELRPGDPQVSWEGQLISQGPGSGEGRELTIQTSPQLGPCWEGWGGRL